MSGQSDGSKTVPMLLRISRPLFECLHASASNGYRSRNKEAIRILELYFANQHGVIVQPSSTRPQVTIHAGDTHA